MEHIEIPEKIPSIIADFTRDLSITFPEYSHLWNQWSNDNIDPTLMKALVFHLSRIFPERFFDILYQNEDIFKKENANDISVEFLPGVDFRILFNSAGVSETTKTAIWKYLQLILVNILNTVKNKMSFGNTADLFEGVDEKALQEKLSETIESIGDFFHQLNPDNESNDEEEDTAQQSENASGSASNTNLPSGEQLHDHLNGLFNGKIGSLAKELAEEISVDMKHMFEEDGTNDVKTTQDLLKKMVQNPKKIMEIIKTIGTKLNSKMQNGEINEEDIMKEATEIMGKMKGMGGGKGMGQFAELFKTVGKGMGMDTKKMNMGALNKMQNKFMTKDRMMQKLEQRRAARAELEARKAMANGGIASMSNGGTTSYNIENTSESLNTNERKNMVFRIDGEEIQQTTSLNGEHGKALHEQDLDNLVAMINGVDDSLNTAQKNITKSAKKNGNKKKR